MMPKEKTLGEAPNAADLPTCGKGLAENAPLPALLGEAERNRQMLDQVRGTAANR